MISAATQEASSVIAGRHLGGGRTSSFDDGRRVAKNRFTTLHSRVAVIPRSSSMLPTIGVPGCHFEAHAR